MQADGRFAVRTLRYRSPCCFFSVALAGLLVAASAAAIPPEIAYQGYLETSDGVPVEGSPTLTFRLYDSKNRVLWQESQAVTVADGIFTAVLGGDRGNPLQEDFFRRMLSISVQVGGEPEMPRQPLATAPYAWRAHSVDVDRDTLAGLGCPDGEMAVRRGGVWTCSAVTADLLAADFTLDVSQLTGLLGEGYSVILPDVIDNTVLVEISPGFADEVIVTTGPGLAIERIPGFWPDGKPLDSPGPNVELPFVFEYAGPQEATLQTYHDEFLATGQTRAIEAIVTDLAGTEIFRWSLLEYALTDIEPGLDGRQRYVFQSQDAPDNLVRVLRSLSSFPTQDSFNPATDTGFEIAGKVTGRYPVVEDDPVERTLTVTFDYVEGGEIFQWVTDIAEGTEVRRGVSIIEEQGGVEVGRTNCYEAFPIRYEQFTGFGQVEKIKERVVLAYSYCEPAP